MRSDTTPAGSRDLSAIWAATRERIAAIVRGLGDDAGDTAVATVPGTTVHDLLTHLVEVADTAAETTGRLSIDLPAGGTPRPATLAESLTAWEKAADMLDDRVAADPDLAAGLITDAVMCEHDLRATLALAGARDDIAIKVALDELSGRFSDRVEAAGLPALRVTVEQWGTIIGAGRQVACVVADRFEFVRAMTGRRSAAEIRRWNWGINPDRYFPVLSEVGLPADEIHERDPRIPKHMRDREFVL